MDLNELASFVQVVEHGTITGAADAEGVPKSTISRRVRRLEESLGVELLRRSSRSFSVTADGMRLYERARGALDELTSAGAALSQDATEPHGTLVLTAPHDIGRAPFALELISEYRRRYPGVRIEIRAEQRMVDLVQEGVDVALRAYRDTIPGNDGLMVRELARGHAHWFASPAYLEGRPTPRLPDLRAFDIITHVAFRDATMRATKSDGERIDLLINAPVIEANDLEVVHQLIERGLGIGLLPTLGRDAAISAGRLVRILPECQSPGGNFGLVWPASRHLAPRVRAFVDLATEVLDVETLQIRI